MQRMVAANGRERCFLERRVAMYKFLLLVIAVIMALAVNVSAQNNIDPEADADALVGPLIDLAESASSIDYGRTRRCCAVTGNLRVQTRDLFVAGDIWRAVVFEGGQVDVTSNTSGKGSGAPALGPGIFGNVATISRRCAWVVTTLGNTAPGGLPAGGETRVTSSSGANVSCLGEGTHPGHLP